MVGITSPIVATTGRPFTWMTGTGDPGLAMTLYLGRHCTGLTLRELGEAAGGMDYSAVAAAIRRFEGKLAQDHVLRS
jgi:hypothetical protein